MNPVFKIGRISAHGCSLEQVELPRGASIDFSRVNDSIRITFNSIENQFNSSGFPYGSGKPIDQQLEKPRKRLAEPQPIVPIENQIEKPIENQVESPKSDVFRAITEELYEKYPSIHQPIKFTEGLGNKYLTILRTTVESGEKDPRIVSWNQLFKSKNTIEEHLNQLVESRILIDVDWIKDLIKDSAFPVWPYLHFDKIPSVENFIKLIALMARNTVDFEYKGEGPDEPKKLPKRYAKEFKEDQSFYDFLIKDISFYMPKDAVAEAEKVYQHFMGRYNKN